MFFSDDQGSVEIYQSYFILVELIYYKAQPTMSLYLDIVVSHSAHSAGRGVTYQDK